MAASLQFLGKRGFLGHSLQSWLKHNMSLNYPMSKNHVPWFLLFASGIWHLWLNRNKIVFRDQGSTIPSLVRATFHHAISIAFFGTPLVNPLTTQLPFMVTWLPPPLGFVKLNTDGCCFSSEGSWNRGGAGAILRDERGQWISATSHRLPGITSAAAELWPVFDGLNMSWDLNFKNVILKSDATWIVHLMTNSVTTDMLLSPFIINCRNLLAKLWTVLVRHTFREGNQVTDSVAKAAVAQESVLTVYLNPPPFVRRFLMSDTFKMSWW